MTRMPYYKVGKKHVNKKPVLYPYTVVLLCFWHMLILLTAITGTLSSVVVQIFPWEPLSRREGGSCSQSAQGACFLFTGFLLHLNCLQSLKQPQLWLDKQGPPSAAKRASSPNHQSVHLGQACGLFISSEYKVRWPYCKLLNVNTVLFNLL